MSTEELVFSPIGVIHSQYKEQEKTPIQGMYTDNSRGEVEVFSKYLPGLKDIEGFSHLILLYYFHLAAGYSLLKTPFLDDTPRGIFSIRHFNRPNPIGLSVVKLESVQGNILSISQVDIVDGTPLLDIKPYIPEFDIRQDARTGWYTTARNSEGYQNRKGMRPEPNAE